MADTNWEDEFDDRFPGDVTVIDDGGSHAMITSHYYIRERLKAFIRTVEAKSRKDEREKQHEWYMCNTVGKNIPVCRKCGIIMRKDGKNMDCPGIVEITLR